MKNKKVLFGLLLVVFFGLILSSCVTNVPTAKGTDFEKNRFSLVGSPKYTVLGTVTLENNWRGIVGFSTPTVNVAGQSLTGQHFYIWQTGGITYVDLLEEAKKTFANADAIVNISVDYVESAYWVFYSQRKYVVSGVAIRYTRNEVDYPPPARELRIVN